MVNAYIIEMVNRSKSPAVLVNNNLNVNFGDLESKLSIIVVGESLAADQLSRFKSISRTLTDSKFFDLLIVSDQASFPMLMRCALAVVPEAAVVIPGDPLWIVPQEHLSLSFEKAAWTTNDAANYLARSGLKGNYVEFGTFWGQSFYNSYFILRNILAGKFFAFDSFSGLPTPDKLEVLFSGGDFNTGEYCCNYNTFSQIGILLGVDLKRIEVVKGMFSDTLNKNAIESLGISERTISVCYIDCDLYASTSTVLSSIQEYLEDGALIYFDDWRLSRASPHVGERGAALHWLSSNSSYELIEFSRTNWQHQWFIFQRR